MATKATETSAPAPVASRTADQVMAALAAPIPADKIKTRTGSGGRQLAYIQAQTVMDRLDEAVGPENWWTEIQMAESWVKCRLTIRFPDGMTLMREGIGGYPDMPAEEDRVKGAASDALKRAGVLFGVARNLYEDHVPDSPGQTARPPAQQRQGSWGPPNGSGPRPQQQPQRQQQGGGQQYGPPRSGRGLFAWAKEHGCVKQVNDLAKAWGLEGRMVDWDEATVKQVYAAAVGESAEAGVGAGEEPADEDNF
jgi:hypothetical protein